MRKKLLVIGFHQKEEFRVLDPYAEAIWLDEVESGALDGLLPSVGCVLVTFWPKELTTQRLATMSKLEFIQSGLAGVNQIPFRSLSPKVVVCSNAGAYSEEVAEYAWALVLAAAKRVTKYDRALRRAGFVRPPTPFLGKEARLLRGKTLGILGYGGIGRSVAKLGAAFGMKVLAYSRQDVGEDGVTGFMGRDGLRAMLPRCDFLVLAIPLTKSTAGMLGREELELMRKDAVVANVGRAEIIDQSALYEHLVKNEEFVYATDVWWARDGQESYSPELAFLELDNFVGTPHAAGPTAAAGGAPLRLAMENIGRFLKGEQPRNVVRREEYL
ncbi:MAG: glycerate dehydrogenase [Thaumarchaeota archaeon]|nr:glycerate dehydrogenase [Nitrososphaerota archaeon]